MPGDDPRHDGPGLGLASDDQAWLKYSDVWSDDSEDAAALHAKMAAPRLDFIHGNATQARVTISFDSAFRPTAEDLLDARDCKDPAQLAVNVFSRVGGTRRKPLVECHDCTDWRLVFDVDLNYAEYDPQTAQIPASIKAKLTAFKSEMFSVQQIFLDLTNVNVLSVAKGAWVGDPVVGGADAQAAEKHNFLLNTDHRPVERKVQTHGVFDSKNLVTNPQSHGTAIITRKQLDEKFVMRCWEAIMGSLASDVSPSPIGGTDTELENKQTIQAGQPWQFNYDRKAYADAGGDDKDYYADKRSFTLERINHEAEVELAGSGFIELEIKREYHDSLFKGYQGKVWKIARSEIRFSVRLAAGEDGKVIIHPGLEGGQAFQIGKPATDDSKTGLVAFVDKICLRIVCPRWHPRADRPMATGHRRLRPRAGDRTNERLGRRAACSGRSGVGGGLNRIAVPGATWAAPAPAARRGHVSGRAKKPAGASAPMARRAVTRSPAARRP